MHNLTKDGTTVLFVSHSMLAVADLCERALLIERGRLAFDGDVGDAIRLHRELMARGATDGADSDAHPTRAITINGKPTGPSVEIESHSRIRIAFDVSRPAGAPTVPVVLNLAVDASDGRNVLHLRSDKAGADLMLGPLTQEMAVEIDDLPLAPGNYHLWLRLVGLDKSAPILWDSQRVSLFVPGDQSMSSVLLPLHRFEASESNSAVHRR
jgi:hypothetical protein